jgi:hypothetical protein
MTIKSKKVCTKKIHRCFSCERGFPAKTQMHYWVGLFEGQFCDSYSCVTCDEIMAMDRSTYPFEYGYVNEGKSGDETPEEFLEKLKLKKCLTQNK